MNKAEQLSALPDLLKGSCTAILNLDTNALFSFCVGNDFYRKRRKNHKQSNDITINHLKMYKDMYLENIDKQTGINFIMQFDANKFRKYLVIFFNCFYFMCF
jgi:hypothetical protein